MEKHEKYEVKLKWGLALKKVLDLNKKLNEETKRLHGLKEKKIIDSFGKLEKESEVTKSTLVNLVQGKVNAEITTWTAILNALSLTLSQFAAIHDSISQKEIEDHKLFLKSNTKQKQGKVIKKKK